MADTTGTFTITNITLLRTLALADATLQTVVDLLGTIIYDWQAGTYDGANYNITGTSVDRAFDLDNTDALEILNVLGTLIADNPGNQLDPSGFTVANSVLVYEMDCQDTEMLTAVKVLAAVLAPFISTSGVFTVIRITARRALDVSQASMDQYADLIGTIIYDWQAGTYDGANYNITSGEETKNYDAAAVDEDTQLAVLWTAIDENRETWIEAWDYEVANGDEDYVLDCDETTYDELADVLYTFLQYFGVTWALSIGGGQYASGPDKASTWVSVADAASGFSAGARVAQGNLAGI